MGRDEARNPFTPGFGNLPRVFTGRKAEFADLDLMVSRLAQGIYEQARLVTGDRGLGKTSLLREFEEEQVEAGHWVVRAAATPGDAIIGRLTSRLAEVVAEAGVAGKIDRPTRAGLRRLSGVEFTEDGLSIDPKGPAKNIDRCAELERVLAEVAALARDRGVVLLLLVDEAQNISREAIGDLFFAVQEVQGRVIRVQDDSGAVRRDSLPFGTVVAGLPGLVNHLKQAGSTFGERSKPIELDAFDAGDMREGLRAFATEGGAMFDADALELVMDACGGYPYFLHVVGSHVWNAGDGDVITVSDAVTGIAEARPYLDAFYEERLRDLSAKQRRYLDAAAFLEAEDRTSGNIAAQLHTTSSRLASTWQALVQRHGLLRPAGGEGRVAFTLPGMGAYLRQHAPEEPE